MMARTLTLAASLTILAACAASSTSITAASPPAPAANATAFAQAPLPYPANALEPVIDAQTMTLHHGKHHRAQVDALNKAVAADARLQGKSLEQLLANVGTYPTVVRNNAGGHWHHQFFWQSMAGPGTGGAPSPDLQAAINASFGSLEKMKAAFNQAGAARFGSGWVWLIIGADGKLAVTSTPNQDNPLMDVAEMKGQPILGNDVWEHAYYLKYQNRRAEYLEAWWQVVDWRAVSDRFAKHRR